MLFLHLKKIYNKLNDNKRINLKPLNKNKIMKTQVKNLKIGVKNQITKSPITAGSSKIEVNGIWENVVSENTEIMKINVLGVEVELTPNWSVSKKSVNYVGVISKEVLESVFWIAKSKKATPYISITNANYIIVCNGKNSFINICPSLIEIL